MLFFLSHFGPNEKHVEHVDRLLGAGVAIVIFVCCCLLGGHFVGMISKVKEISLAPGTALFTAFSFNVLVKASIRETLIS